MGQKVNPHALRIGITRTWSSSWYASKKVYASYAHKDIQIRNLVKKVLKNCGVSHIEIERSLNNVHVNIYTSKPGMIIGKKGDNLDKLKVALETAFHELFTLNIREVKQPDLDAELVGQNIAQQIEKRIPYRRAVKSSVEKIMEQGAIGVKIRVAGRLNGAEIARNEFFKNGNIPLHTFRADIDYAKVEAFTTYGVIGLQVWIYKGEKFKVQKKKEEAPILDAQQNVD